MKRILFFIFLLQSFGLLAQLGLPIQQTLLPKQSLVIDYDFSKSSSYTRGNSTVSSSASIVTGNASLLQSPIFINSLGYLSFNGSTQYLVSPNLRTHFKAVNSTLQKSFTMSLWIYPIKANGVIVSELDSQTPSGGWHASNIEIINGSFYYRIWNGTAITSTSSVALNQWYHLAMVYDGVKLKAYLNGVLQGTQTNDRQLPTNGQYYTIAASETTQMGSGGTNGGFHCAQFKLFQLPLTDSDIMQEYNARKDEFDYTIHSPSTNTNPTYWYSSSNWSGDTFYANAPSPTTTTGYHFTPWMNSPQGWSAGANNTSQYLTLNYDEPAFIKGIVTQPRTDGGTQWVTAANIETSLTGNAPWTSVLSNQALNTNGTSDVRVLFPSPVYAKAVRISPTNWNNHITMRLGLLVKTNSISNSSLILNLDPANSRSYSGTGTALNDLTANATNFTLVNSPTYDANGFFSFNGTNQYASTAHTNTIKPTTGISIEQWLSADDWNAGTSSNYKVSLSNTQGGGYSHNIWNSTFYSYILAGGSYRINSASVANFDGWQHFITTFDGRYTKLYVNGSLANTVDIGSANNTISYAANSTFLGAEAGSGTATEGYYWQGKIGKTQLYSRALSDQEVSQNYYSLKSRYDGLVLKLDAANSNSYAGSGTAWNDVSGSTNNASLVNGPIFNASNGGQIVFDGVNDYANGVAIPTTSGNNSRTVMVWYKSTANRNTVLLDKGGVTDDVAEQLFLVAANGAGVGAGSYPPTNTGGIAVCFWGNDIIYPISSNTLFDGNWHFIAYTYNKANRSVNICFDGTFATTVYQWNISAWSTLTTRPFISPRVLNTTNNPYWIGQSRAAFWGYGGTFSSVNIPSVSIYNRALTEAEILSVYNATRTKF